MATWKDDPVRHQRYLRQAAEQFAQASDGASGGVLLTALFETTRDDVALKAIVWELLRYNGVDLLGARPTRGDLVAAGLLPAERVTRVRPRVANAAPKEYDGTTNDDGPGRDP